MSFCGCRNNNHCCECKCKCECKCECECCPVQTCCCEKPCCCNKSHDSGSKSFGHDDKKSQESGEKSCECGW